MTAADKAPVLPGTPGTADGAAQRRQRREVTSAELFDGGSEIKIRHAEEIYTLRQTARGKLILTK